MCLNTFPYVTFSKDTDFIVKQKTVKYIHNQFLIDSKFNNEKFKIFPKFNQRKTTNGNLSN